MLPQFFMTLKMGEADSLLIRYLIAMGLYRAFYILNWIERYVDPPFLFSPNSVAGGIVQTLGYICFFHFWSRREKNLPLYFTNNVSTQQNEKKYVKALLCSTITLDPEILDESLEIDATKLLAQKDVIVVQLKDNSNNWTGYLAELVKKILKRDHMETVNEGLTVKEAEDSLNRPYIKNIIQANNEPNKNVDDPNSKEENNLLKNTLGNIKTLHSFKIPLDLLQVFRQKLNSEDCIQVEEFAKLIESNLYSFIVCLIKK